MAIFIAYITILNPSDEVVVLHPNFTANIEIPRSILSNEKLYRLKIKDAYQFDLEKSEKKISPNTKLISITYPHNPTGTMISE